MDVSDYLARIGASAAGSPSRDSLQTLHESHLFSVPFENLDIAGGVPIVLEEGRILDKIVGRHRGGFCYELNFAFQWLLARLGYDVVMLSGEVARPDGGFGIPFDHMTLLVRIGADSFLADVGFGESFLRPLAFAAERVHEEKEFDFRLKQNDSAWLLERRSRGKGEFDPQYRFTKTPRALEEFRSGCTYHQTSPDSHFTRSVVVSLARPDGRVTLTHDRLTVRRDGRRTETRIPDTRSFHEALENHFGIVLESS